MNKYKMFSKKIDVHEGEIVQTYGVKYINNPDVKSNHVPYRPFLILQKNNNSYYSLKLTSSCGTHAKIKINAHDYPFNEALTKDSYIELDAIYELEPHNLTKNGVILNNKDMLRVYNKLIRCYCIDGLEINEKLLKKIYKEYRRKKRINEGCLVKSPYFDGYLLVLEELADCYRCIPVHRDGENEFDDVVKLNGFNNYLNFAEEYYLPKGEVIYIQTFDIGQSLFSYIKEETSKKNKIILNKHLPE